MESISAAERLSSCPEILKMIFDWADADPNKGSDDLGHISRANKLFFDIASHNVWADQNDPIKLLLTLPSDIWKQEDVTQPQHQSGVQVYYYSLTRAVTREDIARFQFYAVRIKSLYISNMPLCKLRRHGDKQWGYDVFSVEALRQIWELMGREPLMPSLRRWKADIVLHKIGGSQCWRFFLAPNLREIELYCRDVPIETPPLEAVCRNYAQLVEDLPHCRRVERVSVYYDRDAEDLHYRFLWSKYLRYRTKSHLRPLKGLLLHGPDIIKAIDRVGRFCETEMLQMSFLRASEKKWDLVHSLFPGLAALDIFKIQNLPSTIGFLKALANPRSLRRLNMRFRQTEAESIEFVNQLYQLESEGQPIPDNVGRLHPFSRYVMALTQLLSPEVVEHVRVRDNKLYKWVSDPHEPVCDTPLDLITPFLSFTGLRSLAVNLPAHMEGLDDAFLRKIADKLPNLLALDICTYKAEPKVTWCGMLEFLRLRPLIWLGMQFNTDVLASADCVICPTLRYLFPYASPVSDVQELSNAINHYFPQLLRVDIVFSIGEENAWEDVHARTTGYTVGYDEPGVDVGDFWENVDEHLRP